MRHQGAAVGSGGAYGPRLTPNHNQRPADANQAEATELASVITLANELRAALVEKGLIRGET